MAITDYDNEVKHVECVAYGISPLLLEKQAAHDLNIMQGVDQRNWSEAPNFSRLKH